MHTREEHLPADTGADDPRLMARALGVLLTSAGVIVLAGVTLTRPDYASLGGVYAVGLVALAVGIGALVWARRASARTVHGLFAAGSGLICLGTYFAGAPTGLYAVLLVWLAIVAATFFSPRAVAAHSPGSSSPRESPSSPSTTRPARRPSPAGWSAASY